MRVFTGVILGYLLFALLTYALFQVTHHDPHAPASLAFKLGSVAFGFVFAVAAGFLASFIGGQFNILAARIVALIVALVALGSMIIGGIGWAPMSTLLLLAPSVLLGGWFYRYRAEKVQPKN